MNTIQITPEIWGPPCWIFLHSLSLTYNDKYKYDYFNLIKTLIYILPCYECINHLKLYLIKYKLNQHKISKKYLEKFFIKLHNNINKKLNKKKIKYDDALKLIKHKYYTNNKKILTFFIIINYFYLTQHLSLFHFNKIKNFYKILGNIYPDKIIRKKIKNIIDTEEFKNITNEQDLNDMCKLLFINLC